MQIESTSYEVESEIHGESVALQTLPHHSGHDRERISTIQPTAWILEGPGSYYDPNERRIQKNLVGHWSGLSSSLSRHLWKSITNGCFLAYHIIVIFSFLLTIFMRLQKERAFENNNPRLRNFSLALRRLSQLPMTCLQCCLSWSWRSVFLRPGPAHCDASPGIR
jgi:hypothetical protein